MASNRKVVQVSKATIDFFGDGETLDLDVEVEVQAKDASDLAAKMDVREDSLEEDLQEETPNYDKSVDSDRRGVGPEAVFYAAIEQKVEDVKSLQKLGVIVNGKCIDKWPVGANGKKKTFLNDYDSYTSVNELLQWFYGREEGGGMAGMLEFLGSGMSAEKIIDHVLSSSGEEEAVA
jgi:hypothetical protein